MNPNNDWFTIEEIDRFTFAISEYGHWEQFHSYLLIGQNEACLIDSGLGIGNIALECRKITDKPVKVITTHVHWDHIGGHKYYDKIYVHKDDSNWLENGLPISIESIRKSVTKIPFTKPLPEGFDINKYEVYQGKPFCELSDGDIIEISERRVEIIHTPGHSPGHICILEPETGYLFVGDLIYQGDLFAFFDSTDPIKYAASVRKITKLKKVKRIFPSHNQNDLPISFAHKVNQAFEELKRRKKLKHGSGIHKFDGFTIKI